MRKAFCSWLENAAQERQDLILLTGDLGFMAFEALAQILKERFVNVGVSEQNMMSMAAALAHEGLMPFCYSIAPFAVFRPAEQIRLDICLHQKNVKIIGNGGGYGYGIMGATHHALEDIAVLSSFQNMLCYVPFCDEDVSFVCNAMLHRKGPSYLRLGSGNLPKEIRLPDYAPIRKIASGKNWTIVGMGPVVLNAFLASKELPGGADIFVVSEISSMVFQENFLESIKESLFLTKKLLIIEEHVDRGGLGEWLCLRLMKMGLHPVIQHICAKGYPDHLYGSQAFHQQQSGLSPSQILEVMR
jgi:transketolase